MNTKDISIIIILLIILAIVYKIMQASKVQSELVGGMAVKMGVAVKKPRKRVEEEEEETEDVEVEDEEEEENQEEESQEEDEQQEEGEEIAVEEEKDGKRVSIGKAVVLKVSKKNKTKQKSYERVTAILNEYPLPMRDLIVKYEEQYGEISQKDLWRGIEAASQKGMIVKYQISEKPKRYMYALPEMLDENGKLKQQYQTN